jgi:UDP-glucose 4-epimerase
VTAYVVVGGAGFIGSHVTTRLLEEADDTTQVRVVDNLSSGSLDRLARVVDDARMEFMHLDVQHLEDLRAAVRGADHLFHFAANPDIAAAVTRPDIDFWDGTLLTNNVLEAMRREGVSRLTYASGSGVYGDAGDSRVSEDQSAMHPISTYGASKLACEAMASAYCHMFDFSTAVFRFANVVGPGQTHGVTYDFVRKLLRDPTRLEILGDGMQTKSYVHVDDVVDAMLLVARLDRPGFQVFNVATGDEVSVRQIADLAVGALSATAATYIFSGGSRGWKGDVPVVRFDSSRIRKLGWRNRYTSTEAIRDSIRANILEATSQNVG